MSPNKHDENESERPTNWSDEHKSAQDSAYEIQVNRERYTDEEAEKARQEYLDEWEN